MLSPCASFLASSLAQKCTKNKTGLLVEHVVVHSGYLDAVLLARLSSAGAISLPGEDEVSGDSGLPAAGRLESLLRWPSPLAPERTAISPSSIISARGMLN